MMHGKFFLLSDLILEWCDDGNQNKIPQNEWISGPIPSHLFFLTLKYFIELKESEQKT